MESVPQEKLHHELAGPELVCETAQPCFVGFRGCPESELVPKLLRESSFQPDGGLIVHGLVIADEAKALPQLVLRKPLHSDEEAALPLLAARPAVNVGIYRLPAAQIEIADAKVRTLR